MNGNSTHDVYQMVTDRMVKALESGTIPWRKAWSTQTGGVPRSMSTSKVYRGVNIWLLTLTAIQEGYSSPWWGTFHKIKELGGKVRKGQHGTRVVWWKTITKPDPGNPDETISFMIGRTDIVFNACQAEGLPEAYYPKPADQSEVAELPEPQSVLGEYIATRGPDLVHAHQDRAFYQPGPDVITLPERNQFDSSEEYYSTAFHEAGHSTGHPTRNNRKGIAEFDHFGSDKYGREELTAEMTAVMVCEITGVQGVFDNSAAYVASWIRSIKGDIKLVSTAASQAQAAADFILGVEADTEDAPQRQLVAA